MLGGLEKVMVKNTSEEKFCNFLYLKAGEKKKFMVLKLTGKV